MQRVIGVASRSYSKSRQRDAPLDYQKKRSDAIQNIFRPGWN
jgi:hypothetical protein